MQREIHRGGGTKDNIDHVYTQRVMRKYTNIETRMTRSNAEDTRKAQKQKLKTRNQRNTKGCSQDS